MGYAFMTFEKIKTPTQMVKKYEHNYREIEVANADSEKSDLNKEYVKVDGKNYYEAWKDRMKKMGYAVGQGASKDKTKKHIRKNAVMGLEVVMTLSREDAKNIDVDQWAKDNVEWLRKTFNSDIDKYGDNVMGVVLHNDETTIHLHCMVSCIDDKGNLNARHYISNRSKLIKMQDDYGKTMKEKHNLDRGLKGSRAKHKDIKRYYAALDSAIGKNLPERKENETFKEYYDRVNEGYKDMNLLNLHLRNRLERLEYEKETLIKTAGADIKKKIIEEYDEDLNFLERIKEDYPGGLREMERKAQQMDDISAGIEDSANPEAYMRTVQELEKSGKNKRKKKFIAGDR